VKIPTLRECRKREPVLRWKFEVVTGSETHAIEPDELDTAVRLAGRVSLGIDEIENEVACIIHSLLL
jgi:hypothetical protein